MQKVVPIMIKTVAALLLMAFVFSAFGFAPANAAQENAAISGSAEEAASEETAAPIPDPEPLGIEKREKTFDMLAPCTTMPFEELVGDNGVNDSLHEIPPLPPSDTYQVVVNEYWQFATVYVRDENGEYTVPYRYMVTTTGSRSTPTVKGTFSMGSKYVRFGLFSCGVWGQYWRQITRAFYCHSMLYSRHNPNSYTSSYNKLGTRASHGCVRMMVPDARWVYYNIAPGTTFTIIRGDKEDEEAAAIKAQLVFPPKPDKRPGLVSGVYTVTEAWPGWQGNAEQLYQDYLETLPVAEETDDETETVDEDAAA